MKNYRTCAESALNTGISKCPIDFAKMAGAIIVPQGTTLPADLTLEKLEESLHADAAERVNILGKFVEYAPTGGEAQTGNVGWGPTEITGYSARVEVFTLDRYYPEVHASITKSAGMKKGVYFFDENRTIYGINGDGVLAPFPMSAIFTTGTPYATSSAKATMTVSFCHEDAKEAITEANYLKLDFNPLKGLRGLTLVQFKQADAAGKYKLVEKTGSFDLTAAYGKLIADNADKALAGAPTGVSYDDKTETLTIAGAGTPALTSPKELYAAGIKGIEQG